MKNRGNFIYSKYGWELVVKGQGNFPHDMLRYDKCYPVYETDTGKMHSHNSESVEITLHTQRQTITPRRWESFCWKIIEAYELGKDGYRRDLNPVNIVGKI